MTRRSAPANPAESNGAGPEPVPGVGQYTPLFRRVAALNAAVVVGACVVTILVLSPGKLHSFAASEALVLAGSLLLVVVINLVLLRRGRAARPARPPPPPRGGPPPPGARAAGGQVPAQGGGRG